MEKFKHKTKVERMPHSFNNNQVFPVLLIIFPFPFFAGALESKSQELCYFTSKQFGVYLLQEVRFLENVP